MVANADQREFWTEKAAPKWVTHQEIFDAAFQPVIELLFAEADLKPGASVLDIARVTGILSEAGLTEISGKAHHPVLAERVDMGELASTLTVIGPAANVLDLFEGSAEDASAIAEEIAQAFDGGGIPSEINIFHARIPET